MGPGPILPAFYFSSASYCLLTLCNITHLLIYKAEIIIVTMHEVIEMMKWVNTLKALRIVLLSPPTPSLSLSLYIYIYIYKTSNYYLVFKNFIWIKKVGTLIFFFFFTVLIKTPFYRKTLVVPLPVSVSDACLSWYGNSFGAIILLPHRKSIIMIQIKSPHFICITL